MKYDTSLFSEYQPLLLDLVGEQSLVSNLGSFV